MDNYYNKIKNPKVLRILFKMSVFSVLACFLAILAGTAASNQVVNVRDDKGNETQIVLTGNFEKDMNTLRNDKKLALSENDVVNFSEEAGGVQCCYINRAVDVVLKSGNGTEEKINTRPGVTVEEFLKSKDIGIGKDDELLIEKPGSVTKTLEKDGGLDRKTNVEDGLKVTIKKVDFNERYEDHDVEAPVEKKKDPNLEKGLEKVVQEGEKGLHRIKFKDKVVDGEVVEIIQEGDEVIKEPKTKVVVIGTKEVKSSEKLNKNGAANAKTNLEGAVKRKSSKLTVAQPKTHGRIGARSGVIEGNATSYRLRGFTSTGVRVGPGVIAGDPNKIPYGANVNVYNKQGKLIYSGKMLDYCPTAVKRKNNVVVDLYGANIGSVPIRAEWWI